MSNLRERETSQPVQIEVPVLDFIQSPEWRARLFELNRLRFELTLLKRLLALTKKFAVLHVSFFSQHDEVAEFINESTPEEIKTDLYQIAQDLLLETLSPHLKNSEDTLMVWVGAEIVKPPVKEVVLLDPVLEEYMMFSWLTKIQELFTRSKGEPDTPEKEIPISFFFQQNNWQARVRVRTLPQDTDLGMHQRDIYTLTFNFNSEAIWQRLKTVETEIRVGLITVLQKVKKSDLIDTITGGHTHYINRKKEWWTAIFSLEQLLFFDPHSPADSELEENQRGKWVSLHFLLDRLHDLHGYVGLEKVLTEYLANMGTKRQQVLAELRAHSGAPSILIEEEVEYGWKTDEKIAVRFFAEYFQIAVKLTAEATPLVVTIPFTLSQRMLEETEQQKVKLLEWDTIIRDITDLTGMES